MPLWYPPIYLHYPKLFFSYYCNGTLNHQQKSMLTCFDPLNEKEKQRVGGNKSVKENRVEIT